MGAGCQKIIEPDQGWSWVVAFASWLINLCTNGLLRSQGVLFVALMDSFGVSRQAASWPFSLYIATSCFAGVLTGILLQLLSVRQVLFITGSLVSLGYVLCSFQANNPVAITIFYGVIAGCGNGFVTPSLAVATNVYFVKHRATANGISLSGIACGALIFPYLTTYFLGTYGLRGTFLLLSGVALHVFAGASLLRPGIPAVPAITTKGKDIPNDDIEDPDSVKSSCSLERRGYQHVQTEEDGSVIYNVYNQTEVQTRHFLSRVWILFYTTIKDPLYHLIALSALASMIVLLMFVMIIVDHAEDVGLPKDRATALLSYFSVPDLFGRLCSGWLSDRGFVRRNHLFAATQALAGVVLLLLPWFNGEIILTVLCATLGLLEGVASILTSVLFVDYLGLARLPTALSLWSFSIGITFLITPSLIGVFRDFYGHYDSMFYLMSAFSLSTAFSWILEPCLRKERKSTS